MITMGEKIRLNKYLQQAGICSRRAADEMIRDGRVEVDGKTGVLGQTVEYGADVRVDGKRIEGGHDERIVIAFNKPAGIVCTEDQNDPRNIIRYIGYPKRITYAGRLDKDSEGLMILTNDGDLIERMMRARFGHEKEYEVTVDADLSDEILAGMRNGVPIEVEDRHAKDRSRQTVVTQPCRVRKTGRRSFKIILTQGLNRQIRKMCAHYGLGVRHLRRIRIMNIRLGGLEEGRWRDLSDEELKTLELMLTPVNDTEERQEKPS